MPAYSFKKRFEQFVISLLKTHTLRGKRKRPTVPGDILYLYVGMRTIFCRKILQTICTYVYDARVTKKDIYIGKLKVKDKDAFAVSDGFKDFKDMIQFWNEENALPWKGELISWDSKDPQKTFCK